MKDYHPHSPEARRKRLASLHARFGPEAVKLVRRRGSNAGLVTKRVLRGAYDDEFIHAAGYCLATLLRLPQGLGGQQVAVVVLGARSNAGRFMETQNLFNWLSTKSTSLFAPKPPIQQQ